VSDISGSEMKQKESTHFVPMTSLMLCFVWAWPRTVYKQVS